MKLFTGLCIGLLILLLIVTVNAGNAKIDIKGNLTETSKTSINITAGEMKYTDKTTGISVSSKIKIDNVELKPTETSVDKGDIIFTSGEKDPIATFKYTYFENDTVKETIILKEDKKLSFPITIQEGYKIIPWDYGSWKIVSATSGDTMTGLIAEKPYGIDASGKYVEMNYTWDGTNLNLNYDKLIPVYNITLSTKLIPIYDYVQILYPLTIDPTWTSPDTLAAPIEYLTVKGRAVVTKTRATA